jgi:predicted metalloprotease with PDZ domain
MSNESAIRYRVTPQDPAAHLWAVQMTVDCPDPQGQRFRIPAWIPGSYMIRDFSRNLIQITAQCDDCTVQLQKLDKDTWQASPCAGPITLNYTVYGWELTVRATHLDQTHGFFNGTSLFLWAEGLEDQRCEVELLPPEDPKCAGWKVATAMSAVAIDANGYGTYRAQDYDELIDHPVEMGRFTSASFTAGGREHRVAVTGHVTADLDRYTADLRTVCNEHIALFNEPPPMPSYLFLLMVLRSGYGGLEHRDSTSLICQREDLPKFKQKKPSKGYKKLMGLSSHEYFHLWNIKRLKPAAFVPYDLTRENYTTLLWWFEGATSYYDDLALIRSKVFSLKSYLELLGQTITRVYRPVGRLKQTVTESSFDAWTKFYKQDENATNAIISYYAKGAVIALCLDLTIRSRTKGSKSLDDVMRALWQQYGKKGKGVPEDAIPLVVTESTGLDLSELFDLALHGHGDLPVPELLKQFGLKIIFRPQETESDLGGTKPKLNLDELIAQPQLGAKVGKGAGGAKLLRVYEGGSAHRAGLAANDIIVAIDGLQVDHTNVPNRINERPVGDVLKIHAFRRDLLLEFEVKLLPSQRNFVYIIEDEEATAEAIGLRAGWLASNQ